MEEKMSLVKTKKELNELIIKKTFGNKTVGLVPTMGYLHEGHLSLIRKAKAENNVVVVSVFVNPTQFAPNEDYSEYPRDINRDYKLALGAGADIVFNPEVEEIYVNGASTTVEVEGDITKKLCGKSRPTHFKGVTSIVNILFNIVNPHNAYFGQKDAQQVIVIKKMVRDLHMNVNVVVCPIVREVDGLALSSRNIYLSDEEREEALILNQSLKSIYELYKLGQKNVATLKESIIEKISSKKLANIDYVEILDGETLEEIDLVRRKALVALAVKFGNTRLIDNIFLD
jgi:pantoate--beta-alanine ligase